MTLNCSKRLRILFLCSLSFIFCSLAFCDDPQSALDGKPSVDAAAAPQSQSPSTITTNPTPTPADPKAAVPTADSGPQQVQSSYLYDLKKLIEKSRNNIKQVNEKIKEQAVLKRNQKREERAREYYQKGLQLSDEGKLDEAREYFEKAIRITEHPEMEGYIKESQRRLKKQEDALRRQEKERGHQLAEDVHNRQQESEDDYNKAVTLYKEKKFKEAKDEFEHVEEISPDFKAVRSYLKIVDQDIAQADALAAKSQKVEMDRQQKEAEVARQKEKEVWHKEIDQKENDRKDQISKQAETNYQEAVALYKDKKFKEAKQKFQDLEWVIPNYKATHKYLAHMDRDIQEQQKQIEEEQQKALEKQSWQEEVDKKKLEAARQKEMTVKEKEQQKQLEEQADFVYQGAVALFNKKTYDTALDKFNDVEKTLPDYKSTRMYIAKLNKILGKPETPIPPVVTKTTEPPAPESLVESPVTVKIVPGEQKSAAQMNKEDEAQEARDISELAAKSNALFHQITDIADDQNTASVRKKMARVDKMLNNLKQEKERSIRQITEDETRRQQEQLKAEQQQRRGKAEETYQEALELLKQRDFEKAKLKLLEVENIVPDYKGTRQYLSRMDQDKKKAEEEAVTERERSEAQHLKSLQDQENTKVEEARAAEEARLRKLEQDQKDQLQQLTTQAGSINDDILNLAKEKNYPAMKQKFNDLEEVLNSLKTLKNAMALQKDQQARAQQQAKDIQTQEKQARQDAINQEKKYGRELPLPKEREKRIMLPRPEQDVQTLRKRDMQKQRDMVFKQAVDLYGHKEYAQSKLLFEELSEQGDSRSAPWMRKIERALQEELLKVKKEDLQDRNGYLAERLKMQRREAVMQQQEMARQRKLTEEMERQKRILDEQSQAERRKMEALKLEEGDRAKINQQRKAYEAQQRKEEEKYQFRKIKTAEAIAPPVNQEEVQKNAQVEFSNKRKKFFEDQYQQKQQEEQQQKQQEELQQKQKADQEKKQQDIVNAQKADAAQAQDKIAEEKTKSDLEQKHRDELKRQETEDHDKRDQEKKRLEDLKKQKEDARLQKIKDAQDKRDQEKKRLEDIKKQKEDARQQKIKEAQEKREEERLRREDLKRQKEEARQKAEDDRQKRLKDAEDKRVQDQKHMAELKAQQDEARQKEQQRLQVEQQEKQKQMELAQKEKDAADAAARDEAKRKSDLEQAVQERQQKLNAERDAIRKQMEDGVQAMYEEALDLYKNGQYATAADKFQDVEDILPDYKRKLMN